MGTENEPHDLEERRRMIMIKENTFSFLSGQKTVSVTATEDTLRMQLRKLSEEHPELCTIVTEESGKMYAVVARKCLSLTA